ncbi:hypothetical protein [Nitrosospira sp. Nl5]|uniref:hypothetical protein n=1 Tax=Nitrosospira sp. Nl5 TaxID=200120 RepID=UPI00115FE9F0|nr:hypothetical protein [Nitrosospira sp. Nl5]
MEVSEEQERSSDWRVSGVITLTRDRPAQRLLVQEGSMPELCQWPGGCNGDALAGPLAKMRWTKKFQIL